MSKDIIETSSAPAAVGPYSQAVRAGAFLFTSGQIPLSPTSGAIVGSTVTEQTEQVFRNLRAVLDAAGLTLSDVVKTTVFMVDLCAFAEMNEVYAQNFTESLPARSTIQVAALPKGALVEIEAVALIEPNPT